MAMLIGSQAMLERWISLSVFQGSLENIERALK
jgi:hypothetical protein